MKSVYEMSEAEVREKAKDPGWAVTQILFLRGEAKTAQAMITDLALPRIADLEVEVAALREV
jgi:hypothetical protein